MTAMDQAGIVKRMYRIGCGVWACMCLVSLVVAPAETTVGIILGGMVVVANLFLLNRFVARTMKQKDRVVLKRILFKYYLTFFFTAFFIAALMVGRLVDFYGLLLGLSIFAITLFIVVTLLAGKIVYENITKEAY